MQKIPTVFEREQVGKKFLATPVVNPECQWVLDGEGVPTRKWDGTAVLRHEGQWYARRVVKEGKAMPEGWLHWSFNPEQKSGHGWEPVTDAPQFQHIREAIDYAEDNDDMSTLVDLTDGTYEAIGPAINGNHERLAECHCLRKHGAREMPVVTPRTYESIRLAVETADVEGIVFHHPDGRMAKAKRRDFGIPWPSQRRGPK